MEGLALGAINFYVLPILGGYWFQYKFTLTHYRAERLTPQRLIFHAGLYALGLVVAARLMILVADIAAKQPTVRIDSYLFSAIFAFIVLVLFSMGATGLHQYWPESPSSVSETIAEAADISPNFEMKRLALGIAISAILLLLAVRMFFAMSRVDALPTELGGVVIFAVLILLSYWQHHFINQYMEFTFLSIGLRIGLFGVIASLALANFIFAYPVLVSCWNLFVNVPGSGVTVVACALGLVLWWPLNLLYPYQAANTRLHHANRTTALDRLLYQASLAQHLLCLSMKDGKVYIGYIQDLPPNPEDRNSYLEILPVQSGYRDQDTREMKLTTFYEEAYKDLVEAEADEEDWLVYLKILKIDEILSAGRFDPDAYVRFNRNSEAGVVSDGGGI